MNFGSDNGTIWGTPTTDMSSTNYTVTANNSAGSFSTTFSMQIMSAPSGITYSPSSMTLEKGTAMTTNTPSYSGSTVTSWSISPALPSGLNFDTSTGAISGTPSVLQTSSQSYTVTATNGQGSATTSVSITINDQAPVISYTSPIEISNNREMTTATPTNTGGSSNILGNISKPANRSVVWLNKWKHLGCARECDEQCNLHDIYANNSGGSASATLTLNMNWTLTPSVDGAYITRNSSIGTDITWEWDYDPLEASNLTMYATWRNTCAIRNDGDVYCWGRNGNGQLGIGSMGSSTWKDRPTKTNNLGSDAVSVSMGEQHTCAVLDTGVLKCWGRNNHGQVGVGSGGDKDAPQTVNVGSGRTTTSVYLGYHHTCAILDDQSVKCWGRNQDGELGVGSTTSSFNTPQSIASLGTNRHAVSLALGQGFTCALLDDGSIKCWGQDNLANVAMVVDTVAIFAHLQVQPFLSLLVELQHKSQQENSMSALSLMMTQLFVGARTQKDNWVTVQPRIALRQLPPHRSVLDIQCPTFQLVTTMSALCLPMVAYAAGEATTTDNLVMEHRQIAPPAIL